MTWDYITGFFDADGSITLSNPGNSRYKTVSLSFHNNELEILNKIKRFIEKEIGVKGVIVEKKPRSINHNISYDLKYDFFNKVLLISENLKIEHPKKKHRVKIAKELNTIIPKNGKYTPKLLERRAELEQLFFEK